MDKIKGNNKLLILIISFLIILNIVIVLLFIPKKEKLTVDNHHQYYYINPCSSFEINYDNYNFYGEIKKLKEVSGYVLVLDIMVEINYYDSNNSLCQILFIESKEINPDVDNSFIIDTYVGGYSHIDFKKFAGAKVEYQVIEVRKEA